MNSTGVVAVSLRDSRINPTLNRIIPNSLPLPLTSWVGREKEINELGVLLRQDEIRLLTLTGPAGVGKTRLSLQVAQSLLNYFDQRVVFVYLAAFRQAEELLPAISQAVGLNNVLLNSGNIFSPLENLKIFLQDKKLLLLLDNFEHLIEGASLVQELIYSVGELKILVTSREPLHIYGEHQYALKPLEVPDTAHLGLLSLEKLEKYEAVKLFVERVRQVKRDFELTSENAEAIARLCTHLDGLPLALELAAARIKLFSPQALLKKLEEELPGKLDLLSQKIYGLPDRQQTLRGALEWSYRLLNEDEQKVFTSLGLFRNGASLEAVEEITDFVLSGEHSVLDILSSLVDKSLVKLLEDRNGDPRFFLLEMMREYALEKITVADRIEDLRHRHADYYAGLAMRGYRELRGEGQFDWINILLQERDNMQLALDWLLRHSNISGEVGELNKELAAEISQAMLWAYYLAGQNNETRHWAMVFVNSCPAGQNPIEYFNSPTQANVVALAAVFTYVQGDLQPAKILAENGLELGIRVNSRFAQCEALQCLSYLAYVAKDYDRVAQLIAEIKLRLVEEDDPWLIATYYYLCAISDSYLNRLEEAINLFEQARSGFKSINDIIISNHAGVNLSGLLIRQGEYTRAKNLIEEILGQNQINSNWHRGILLFSLAHIAYEEKDFDRAVALFQESLPILKEAVDRMRLGSLYYYLGLISKQKGDFEGARRSLNESLRYNQLIGDNSEIERVQTTLNQLKPEALAPISKPSSLATKAPHSNKSPDELSEREIEVLGLVVQGLSNQEIGEKLSISPRTVNTHLTNIYSKLGVTSRVEAVHHVLQKKLL